MRWFLWLVTGVWAWRFEARVARRGVALRAEEAPRKRKTRGMTVEEEGAVYYAETEALWLPVLEIVDVRCALEAREVDILPGGVTTVKEATAKLRRGEVDVRRRYRAGASVMVPRYAVVDQKRRQLQQGGRWDNAVRLNDRRVDEAAAIQRGDGLVGGLVKVAQTVLQIDAQAAPISALLSYGNATTRWASSELVAILEDDVEKIALRAARLRLAEDLKLQGKGAAWCRDELGLGPDVDDDAALDAYVAAQRRKEPPRNAALVAIGALGVAALVLLQSNNMLFFPAPDEPSKSSLDATLDSLLSP